MSFAQECAINRSNFALAIKCLPVYGLSQNTVLTVKHLLFQDVNQKQTNAGLT